MFELVFYFGVWNAQYSDGLCVSKWPKKSLIASQSYRSTLAILPVVASNPKLEA